MTKRCVLVCMAIFQSTAFSKMRKSFGNLTTYRSKGKNIVKEKVTEVSNPKTLPQRKQRTKFPALVELSGVLSQALSLGFASRPKDYTPENYFVHLNKEAMSAGDDLEVMVDYEALVLSKGNRALPSEMSVSADAESHSLTFTIGMEEFVVHSALDDEFYATVLEKEKMQAKVFLLGTRAEVSEHVANLPASWDMEQLEVYVFVVSKTHKKASKTVYLTVA